MHAEEREADICGGVEGVPHSLAEDRVREDLEADGGLVVCGEGAVRWETEDTWWGSGLEGLVVELDVPDARGGIKRLAGLRRVDEELVSDAVGADQGDEILDTDRLVVEQGDQGVWRGLGVGKELILVDLGAVGPANPGKQAGAERARNGSNVW